MLRGNDLATAKKNCQAFWDKEWIGRPFLCVTAPKDGYNPSEMSYDNTYVRRMTDAENGDYTSSPTEYARYIRNIVHYGEAMPFYNADLCPDQCGVFFGGTLVGQPGTTTSWCYSIAEEAAALDLTLDPNNATYKHMTEGFRKAAEIANGDFFVSVPDYHSNMDTLSALLNPANLCFEMMDHPEDVMAALEKVNSYYNEIYENFYRAGNMAELGTVGWQPVYCSGRSAMVQCDFSCMISPDDARKYVVPSIELEVSHLDHCCYHYDGKQALGHLDDILAIQGIDAVQWVPGDGEPRTIEWMDLLKKIQKAGKSVWIYDWTAEEILADRELDPRLTVFSLSLPSQSEAEAFMKKMEQKY